MICADDVETEAAKIVPERINVRSTENRAMRFLFMDQACDKDDVVAFNLHLRSTGQPLLAACPANARKQKKQRTIGRGASTIGENSPLLQAVRIHRTSFSPSSSVNAFRHQEQ